MFDLVGAECAGWFIWVLGFLFTLDTDDTAISPLTTEDIHAVLGLPLSPMSLCSGIVKHSAEDRDGQFLKILPALWRREC